MRRLARIILRMFRGLFTLQPSTSPALSAPTYVPIVIFSRVLAFLRVLLVARILGNAGQREFGLQQVALEFINWIIPLVLLGLADVIERYASFYQLQHLLRSILKRHLARVLIFGVALIVLLLAASPFLAHAIFRLPNDHHSMLYGIALIGACAMTILLLALDIYLAGLLRGLRFFTAAAGFELLATVLLFALSLTAAFLTNIAALALLLAYAASLLIPIVIYAMLLKHHLNAIPLPNTQLPLSNPPVGRFATFSLVRLLLTMSFNFTAVWSVGYLAVQAHEDPQLQTAAYTMPFRIAQLLAYVAITLWSSVYGIAAQHYAHLQTRRAKVQLFRVGKFGAALLLVLAVCVLLARPIFAALLPSTYAVPLHELLPPMLALFIWYGLVSFAAAFADLQEKPQISAALWAAAFITQFTLVLIPFEATFTHALAAAVSGIAVALLLSPILLWRTGRGTTLPATAVPLLLLALAPISLLAPTWIVSVLAPPILLAPLVFLQLAGLLLRPLDRRSLRKIIARL